MTSWRARRRPPPSGERPLLVVGDALLDRDLEGRVERLLPDEPVPVVEEPVERHRPGGAALAATLASRLDGREVVLVTALGADERGALLAGLLADAGVALIDLGLSGPTPEKARVRVRGRTLLRLDYGGRAARPGPLGPAGQDALAGAGGVLVADYGRGLAAEPSVRAALAALAALPHRVPVVWDPHPKGAVPLPGARLVTPNQAEVAWFAATATPAKPGATGRDGHRAGKLVEAERPRAASPEPEADGFRATDLAVLTARARALAGRWKAAGLAVTLGSRGALLVGGEEPPLLVPAAPVHGADACGAGDRFASAAAGLLAEGALPSEAVTGGVAAATAFVAEGGASGLRPGHEPRLTSPPARASRGARMAHAERVVAATRARGGTVVAAGGCFDLVHAGHIAMLRAARQLGDSLVVFLNSDASVRRLKGLGRPLVPEADRAAVLAALGCVDAVVVFDESTPERVLERLRPDVFAKGGDYALADLPEAQVVAAWGGQAVVLPYLEGRSTSGLLKEVVRRGSG